MKGKITATRERIEGAVHRNNELKRVGYEAAKLVREGLAGMIGKKVGKADGYLTKAAEAIIPHDTVSLEYCGIPKASSEPGEAPTIAPTICGGIHYSTFFVRVRLCFVSEKGIATYEETTIDLGRIENDGKLTELLPFPTTAPQPVDVAEQIEKVEAYYKAHQAAAEAWDALHFSVRSLADRY